MKRSSSGPSDYRSIEKLIHIARPLSMGLQAVLYGRPGTGKTTLACSWPKPLLLIDVKERGTDSIHDVRGVHVLNPREWSDFDRAYWYVRKNKDKFKSVVIDTVSQGQDLAIEDIKESDSGAIGQWGSLTKKEWGQISTMLKTMVLDFRDLNMNMVFIAHDRVFGGGEEDDDEAIAPSVGPRLMPSVASTLNAAVGVIGNTFIREETKTIKLGKEKRKVRRVQYCLRIGPHSYYLTKMRKPRGIEIPAFIIDPSYEKIANAIIGKE